MVRKIQNGGKTKYDDTKNNDDGDKKQANVIKNKRWSQKTIWSQKNKIPLPIP